MRNGSMRRWLAIGFLVSAMGFPNVAEAIRDETDDTWQKSNAWGATEQKPKSQPPANPVPKVYFNKDARRTEPQSFVAPATPMRQADPDAIAVVIANSGYRQGIPPVDYARNDGQAAQAIMRDIFGVRPGNIIAIDDAGQAELTSVFGNANTHEGKLWSWIRPGRSKIYIYYSGHGVPGLRDGRSYLLPVDADPDTAEINGYPLELLYKNLNKLGARSVTVILEACFSGQSESGPLVRSASPVFVKSRQPTAAAGMTILSAAQGDQIASWDHAAGLGMFTSLLVRALYGEADRGRWGNGDGEISLAEVEAFLDDELTYAARREYRRVQQSSLVGDRGLVLVTQASGTETGQADRNPVPANGYRAAGVVPAIQLAGVPVFNGGLDAARVFVDEHRSAVTQAIRAYYRVSGSVWDSSSGGHGTDYSAERMDVIGELNVIGVDGDTIDVYLAYTWKNSYVGGSASANMKFQIDPDGLRVTRMWR